MFDRVNNIVVLTGAGISAESGIRTFRDGDGLWEEHRVEDVATPQAYRRDPELVHRFYNARRAQLREAQPNPAHFALAHLEREWIRLERGSFILITQNVDDLHERGGSERVLHMHGELRRFRCTRCEAVFECEMDLSPQLSCVSCKITGSVRPHIVWFGEIPLEMSRIEKAVIECDLFIAIGTSGQVYPAAGLVHALPAHAHSIEMNPQSTPVSPAFRERREGPAGTEVPRLVEEMVGLPADTAFFSGGRT